MTKFVLIVQLKIPQNTPQFIWPILQNRPIIWNIFEKAMSIVHEYDSESGSGSRARGRP